MATKESLPFSEQAAALLALGAYDPGGYVYAKKTKPQFFDRLFGGRTEADLDPYRRYTQTYNPFSFGANYLSQVPGQPFTSAVNTLGGSIGGLTAPLDQSNYLRSLGNQEAFTQSLQPGGGGYGGMTSDIFSALGGQLPYPTVPQLPGVNFDIGGRITDVYNQLGRSTPGYLSAQSQALDPDIFGRVDAYQGSGALDKYVQGATAGITKAFDSRLADQDLALRSRFAQEGSYLSGPMLNALGELNAQSNAEYAGVIGQLQLQAAENERNRVFTGATSEAQIQADTVRSLANTFASIANQTGSTEASTLANLYATQADFLEGIYGQQLNATMAQQQLATQGATQRGADVLGALGGLSGQYRQAGLDQQGNQQAFLDALRREYYQPGENLLQVLQPLLGLPALTKTTGGGGFDIGAALNAAATIAAA